MNRLEALATFVQVVHGGSITAVAKQRNLAKSAISRRLSDLERRLGVQLLTRTTRKMSLTDAGSRFLEHAERILEDLDAAEAEATSNSGRISGRLRVAAPLSFGLLHLSPALHEFARTHPDIQLELDFSDRQVDLVEDRIDLAIRIARLPESALAARPFTTVRHAVVASPDYLALHGVPQSPTDLEEHACLLYTNSEPRWSYTTAQGKTGSVRIGSRLRANNGQFITDAAIAGLGIAMQPTFIAHEALRSGQLRQVLTNYHWRTITAYAVYPQTYYLPLRVRAFIDFLITRFHRQQPYWDRGLSHPDD